jgi:hypothetical protein
MLQGNLTSPGLSSTKSTSMGINVVTVTILSARLATHLAWEPKGDGWGLLSVSISLTQSCRKGPTVSLHDVFLGRREALPCFQPYWLTSRV